MINNHTILIAKFIVWVYAQAQNQRSNDGPKETRGKSVYVLKKNLH